MNQITQSLIYHLWYKRRRDLTYSNATGNHLQFRLFRICLCCFFHACPCCLFCACELHIWVRTVSEQHSTEFHPETFRHYGTANFHTTTYCWCAIFIMIHNISVIWSEGAFRYTGTRMNLIDSTELLGWRICSWPECFLREWDSKVYSTVPIVKVQA